MNLYFCRFVEADWGCYVIAPTPSKARSLFSEHWPDDGDYIDTRCRKIRSDVEGDKGVYDIDCPALAKLGVRYKTQEELDEELERI